MPRGRHRHSPPLHRLLPPSAVAGVSVLSAGGAWMFAEPLVLRGLAAVVAAAAVVGSVVMRRWDQAAGKQIAELGRARASDEWRHEERIAEAEADLEESRELRGRLETKLRAKRAELAALRNEHADLLRRYATAETERASALEGRRLLAIEASAPAPALSKAGADDLVPGAVDLVPAVRAGAPVPAARTADRPARPAKAAPAAVTGTREGAAPTPSLFQRANAALDRMTSRPEPAPAAPPVAEAGAEDDGERGQEGAADGYGGHERAVAVAPPVQARRPAPQGGFDFFGNEGGATPASLEAVQDADLADVVGEEALAVHKAEAEAEADRPEAAPESAPEAGPEADAERGVGQVIDLTAHDETEQLDMADLRTALRA
ncbi:hypothetical protein H9W91_21490 [Streptomyces alfalfae]|uniref:hypothetical protein n=1 Tax=Streptomyces alfalfae TaxID=1642299 RepID=UPI001BABDC97|nr:hypothetical protein [Streptomyces alfalfae]QUI33144.1 hypothetical protein H9W91_21490 [Streptomyces alfalfae]